MAVLSIMKVQGDADELMERMARMREVAARKAKEYNGVASIVARTDDGIMIVNLWADDEGRHKMADDPEMREQIESAGLRPDFEAYEVLTYGLVD